MFKKRFTKWIPLLVYNYNGDKFLTMVRRNLNTGELYFSNKKINRNYCLMQTLPTDIFDPKEQFHKVLAETNPQT